MTFDVARSASAALTRGLLRAGMAAGPLFVTVFLAEVPSADYQPSRHPVSSLSLGPWLGPGRELRRSGNALLAGAAGLSRSRDPIMGTGSCQP